MMDELPVGTLGRRSVLKAAGAGALLASIPGGSAAGAEAVGRQSAPRPDIEAEIARARKRVKAGWKTQNGWDAENGVGIGGAIWPVSVAGSPVVIDVNVAVSAILSFVVAQYHYGVQQILADEVVSFVAPAHVERGLRSNLASGTALLIRPGASPRGSEEELFPLEQAVIEEIVTRCEGVVSWGRRRDAAYFGITVPPTDYRVAAVSAKLRGADRVSILS